MKWILIKDLSKFAFGVFLIIIIDFKITLIV